MAGTAAQWILAFAARHIARCRKPGWPDLARDPAGAAEFFRAWVAEFDVAGITETDADLASARLATTNFDYPGNRKHLDKFMYYAREVADARGRDSGRVDPGSISWDHAERLSWLCPECAAGGMTARPMLRDGRVYSCSFFCVCPAGEWLAHWYFAHDKGTFRRMRRLIQYPELWDADLAHHSWPELPRPRPWALESCWDVSRPAVARPDGAAF